jgi:hypothetical protein
MNETPKPKPPVRTNKVQAKQVSEETKKPYIRKDHLTSRPFQNHPGLNALRKTASEEPRPRHPGEQPRRASKKGTDK